MRRTMICGGVLTVLALGASGSARADLPVSHDLPSALAAQAVTAAVESCASQGYHVSAAVVDKAGVVRAVLRGDGATPHTLDTSRGKAYTASTFGPLQNLDTTAELAKRMSANGPSPLASVPGILFAAGGIVIKTGSEVIGAIGVGGAPGGDKDEACAKAGIDKIRAELGG